MQKFIKSCTAVALATVMVVSSGAPCARAAGAATEIDSIDGPVTETETKETVQFDELENGTPIEKKVTVRTLVGKGGKVTLRGEDGSILANVESGKTGSLDVSVDSSITVEVKAKKGFSIETYSTMTDSGDLIEKVNVGKDSLSRNLLLSESRIIKVEFSEVEKETESESAAVTTETESEAASKPAKEIGTVGETEPATEAESVTEPATETESEKIEPATETETESEAESVAASVIEDATVEDTVTDIVAETYLKEHVAQNFISSVEKVELVSAMVAKQTLVDRAVTGNNPTIDGVMASEKKGDALITQFDSVVALYDLAEDSKYCVGLVNTMLNDANAKVTDYDFAEYNNNGVLLDGCYYDRYSGIAYVPKSLLVNEEGNTLVGYVQVQLLQVIGYSEGENVESAVLAGTVIDDEVDASAESAGIFSMQTTVQAKAGLDEESVEVAVNGVPLDEDVYEYDKESGEVVIEQSSATIGTVSVTADEETIFTRIRKFFGPKKVKAADPVTPGQATALGSGVKIHVSPDLDVTKAITGTVDFLYADKGEASKPSNGYITAQSVSQDEHELREMADFITKESGGISGSTSIYKASSETNFWIHLDTLDLGEKYDDLIQFKDLDDETVVALTCAHIGKYLGVNTAKGRPAGSGGLSYWWQGATVKVRVLYVESGGDKPYVLIGIVTEDTFTQTGIGIVKLYTFETEQTGKLKVRKTPDNQAKVDKYGMAANGGIYDMTAVFGVYSSRDAAEKQLKDKASRPGIVRTGPWGRCKQPLVLDVGTYWLREIRTEGSGILVNDEIRKIEIKKNQMTYVGYEVDSLLYEPHVIPISVRKVAGDAAVVSGNANYSLAGAVYGLYEDAACTRAMVAKDGTAITMTTKADGTTDAVLLSDISNYGYGTYYVKEIVPPAGYALDTTVHPVTINEDSLDATVTSTDAPKVAEANFSVRKAAKYQVTTKPTANAVFKVEYFTSYDCSGTPVRTWKLKSTPVGKTSLSTVSFDTTHWVGGDEFFTLNNKVVLPLGSIRVTEETAPNGYALSDEVFTGTIRDPGASSASAVFTWTSGNIVNQVAEMKDDMNFAGLVLQKVDECVYAANGSVVTAESVKSQGDASLDGAVFAVYNANEYNVVTSKDTETPIAKGEEVCRIVTEGGKARTETVNKMVDGKLVTEELLMADSYYRIVEINPSTGMKKNEGFDKTIYLPDTKNYVYGETPEEALELRCLEPVKRGDVQIQKFDKELGKSEAIAGKDHGNSEEDVPNLAGIEFEIRNVSANPIYLYGDPEQVVSNEAGKNLCATIVTHWNEEKNAYTAETTGQALPYGTYTIQEVKTNETYLLTDGEPKTFSIRDDGTTVVSGLDGEPLVFENIVVRGDAEFNKIANQSSRRMQTVWVISNNVTGEKHAIVTDKNGYFNSSAEKNKHSNNTNGNDGLLIHQGTDYVIKASEIDDRAGVWFGLGESGSIAKADDSLGALPYGSYTLSELRCEDNEGFDLLEFTFWVGDNGVTVNLGTLTDFNDPKISTSAVDSITKGHFSNAGEDTVIIDTVHCTGLDKGTEYMLRASIHDYEDEESVFKVNGRRVKVEKVFTATAASMDVPVEIAFDATEYAGKTGVVFEELYCNNKKVAEHTEIEDEEQRIYFPAIGTKARDGATGEGVFSGVNEDGKAVIIDTVAYVNLVPGNEYVMRGAIYDRDSGKLVSDTVEQVFTTEEAEGTVELQFEFDPGEGESFVVFERLYYGDAIIADHEDLDDENQTVRKPSISTTAKDSETGFEEAFADEEVSIIDTVTYRNLKTGLEYCLKGVLMDKETGEPLLIDGKSVTAEATFVPEEKDGSTEVTFVFNATGLAGKSLVVFEDLYYGEFLIASHADLEDVGQTITLPEVKTNALDSETGTNEALADEAVKIVDRVSYRGLTVGKVYSVSGVLMDKKTGEPLLVDGKKITSEKEFTAETAEGTVDLEFVLNASALAGETVVVFEDLYREGKLVGTHADLEDREQTVYFPKIGTQAIDRETGTNEGKADKETTIVDTVFYSNLAPETEYVVQGILMDGETGEPLIKVDGSNITASVTFTTPKDGVDENGRVSGSIELAFVFDSTLIAGKDTVVFERLYRNEKEIAVHTDLEDEGQTVGFPSLKTTATDKVTGTHEQLAAEKATIVDVVEYSGLVVGKEYVVKGTLYDKSTKKPLVVGKKPVTSEKKFTPEKPNDSIELEFTFDSFALAGKTVVVFEDLYRDEKLVGVHADITDKDQSVTIPKIGTAAKDKKSGKQEMTVGKKVSLVDTVEYEGLQKGEKYVVKGTLIDKETGKPIEADGKPITAKKSFKAKAAKGKVEVVFTFDTEDFQGKTLVVFEELEDAKGNLIAEHKDVKDKKQTVTIPKKEEEKIKTVAGQLGELMSPKTGDESKVELAMLIALIALLVIIVSILAIMKKRKPDSQG